MQITVIAGRTSYNDKQIRIMKLGARGPQLSHLRSPASKEKLQSEHGELSCILQRSRFYSDASSLSRVMGGRRAATGDIVAPGVDESSREDVNNLQPV